MLTYTKRFLCQRMTFWQLLPTESQNKKDIDLFWVNNKSDVIDVYALSLISNWLSRGKILQVNSLWAFRGTSWVKKWSQQSVSCFWCNRKEGVRQTSKFTEENHPGQAYRVCYPGNWLVSDWSSFWTRKPRVSLLSGWTNFTKPASWNEALHMSQRLTPGFL